MTVKHISLVHRPAGMTHEAFVHYWKHMHAELVRTKLPGLRKYVGNIPCHPPGRGAQLQCDAVVGLHFDSIEALQAAMSSPG